jgi:hypothetical protein
VHDHTVSWGILNITLKRAADGSANGFQMTCKHPAHDKCNNTNTIGPNASSSEEEAIRMLNFWALAGRDLPDKASHRDAWTAVLGPLGDGTLPSMEYLDHEKIESGDQSV